MFPRGPLPRLDLPLDLPPDRVQMGVREHRLPPQNRGETPEPDRLREPHAAASGQHLSDRESVMHPLRAGGALVSLSLLALGCSGAATSTTAPDPGPSSTSAPVAPAPPFYGSQDTIEIIVPFGEGGEADFLARYVAEHLQPHLPGGAGITVVNVPGAEGVIGANAFADRRAADGLTVLLTRETTVLAQVFTVGMEEVRYDVRDWTPILALPAGSLTYARADTGITGAGDLASFSGTLRFGATRPDPPTDLLHLLAFDLLGFDYDAAWGYEGTGALNSAFVQGELDLRWSNARAQEYSRVVGLVENGTAVPLFSAGRMTTDGVVRDPAQPDLPHPGEVYEQIFGVSPAQRDPDLWRHYMSLLGALYTSSVTLWVPSDTPDDAIRDLQTAVLAMSRSEEFLSTRGEFLGDYEPVVDPVVLLDPAWTELLLPDPATIEYLERYLSDRFGLSLR
jgi:hypothetical protein